MSARSVVLNSIASVSLSEHYAKNSGSREFFARALREAPESVAARILATGGIYKMQDGRVHMGWLEVEDTQ